MTEPKPLADRELEALCMHLQITNWMYSGRAQELCERIPATIRERDATIKRRGELIAWLESMRHGQPRLDVLVESAPHEWQKQNARDVLAIVAGLEQD